MTVNVSSQEGGEGVRALEGKDGFTNVRNNFNDAFTANSETKRFTKVGRIEFQKCVKNTFNFRLLGNRASLHSP